MTKARFLILSGDGINCEQDTRRAVEATGALADIIHINLLCEKPSLLENYQCFIIPGGFSFGDHLGSGQVLALKLEKYLKRELQQFIESKKLILGICNGFQALTRLGLLPDANFKKTVALVSNESGQFINKWVALQSNDKSNCVWIKKLPKNFRLPIRHGEGRLICNDKQYINQLVKNNQIVLRYEENVNGSYEQIAGICDATGRVFALMPHPEAAIYNWQSPENESVVGSEFFMNAKNYIENEWSKQ